VLNALKKIDKSMAVSIALHVGVVGWGLVSFSTRALDAVPQESLPVDIISTEQMSQLTKGSKTGQKEAPKPFGRQNRRDQAAGRRSLSAKIDEKKDIRT
jgi:colicin import membrane protein